MSNTRRTTTLSTQKQLAALQAQCKRLATSVAFGCLTRNGLDEAIAGMDFSGLCLVYMDVDDLKLANERWGKSIVNQKITQALHMRNNDIIIGQRFSGDEFAAFVPQDDAYEFAMHWQSKFRAVELGVSICITPIKLGASIEQLGDACDERLTIVKKYAKGLIIYL
jgi:predicted signal transduction protein with EAL and GGDEF domain